MVDDNVVGVVDEVEDGRERKRKRESETDRETRGRRLFVRSADPSL